MYVGATIIWSACVLRRLGWSLGVYQEAEANSRGPDSN